MTNLISAHQGPSEGEDGHGGTDPLVLCDGFERVMQNTGK